MDLIKRHYEKVILLGLFVLFVGLMFLVQSVIDSTESVSDAELKLVKRKPDFENEAPTLAKFDTGKLRESTSLKWGKGKKDSLNSDFVEPFPMAACPHCRKEKLEEAKKQGYEVDEDQVYTMLVPLSSFSTKDNDRNCPQCGKGLLWVKEITADEIEEQKEREADRDGDGVMDELERQYGMDPSNPHDARYDSDGDGFSNIFEIENEYVPNDAESHPPYWWRLYIKKIDLIKLPVSFMSLNDNKSKNKHDWILQFNHPDFYGRNRIASSFLRIGDTIAVEKRIYKIVDVERRLVPAKKSEKTTTAAEKKTETDKGMIDRSRVTLVENNVANPDKLVMEVGQPAYSSDKRPVLIDSGDVSGKEYILKIGDTIRLGLFKNDKDGAGDNKRQNKTAARYRLKSVDDEKEMIVLEEVKKKGGKKGAAGEKDKPVVIELYKKTPKVPEQMFPIKKVNVNDPKNDELTDEAPRKKTKKRR